jgi:STE24 endopeptidase
LPFSDWRGFVHEHRFGLSTQTRTAWFVDWVKGLIVSLAITVITVFGLVVLARELDGWWPAVAAPVAFVLVILLTFIGPVVTEPLFNRFEPLEDNELANDLRALSAQAGVPVRQVLVADASRRTRRQNAYVSGLNKTRRVVLYDTLVDTSPPGNVRLVTAHELAHQREHHVAIGSLLGATSAAAFVLLLWALLSSTAVLDAIGASGAADPRIAPFVLLVGRVVGLVTLPFGSWLSRRWERVADRVSLELTSDLASFESVHRELALSNLADLEPPTTFYSLTFSHPTAPERIIAARQTAVGLASS